MSEQIAHGIRIDVCLTCAGIWFDDGELTQLQKTGLEAMAEVEDRFVPMGAAKSGAKERPCPVCAGVLLEEYAYLYSTPVKIDGCPVCYGVWIQDGELKQMEQFLETGLHEPITEEMQSRLDLAKLEADHAEAISRHRAFQQSMRLIVMRKPWIW